MVLGASALGMTATALKAQSPSPAELVVRLTDPVRFDGVVDDDEWGRVPLLPVKQYGPTFDGPMSVVSELRLAYDDTYIYLAARCYDDQPLTRTTYRRDNWSSRDDQIALALDTFNDAQNASIFVLFASGARVDAQLSNDGREQSDMNTDWNSFWDGRVSEMEDGWQAEIRIPLSSLRFAPSADGEPVVMGVGAYRHKAIGREQHNYPGIPPDWGFWSFLKPSKLARRAFPGVSSDNPFYVSPYMSSGIEHQFDLNDSGTAYERSGDFDAQVGLDMKYSVTSNLTLDLTANTDFAQVEADDQQVNLTRFSLFFPEKRQFFLERTSNFDFSFGGNDRVFYSRRIGLDKGQAVRLIGGGRLVGRVGDWDVGLLTLQTGAHDGGESENFGVVRLKKQVLNRNSYVGGIATNRVDMDGRYNTALGADALVNVYRDDYLLLNWAQTMDSGPDSELSLEGSRFRAQYQRARETGFNFNLGLGRAGALYDPGVGFQRRTDYSHAVGKVGFGARPDEPARIRNYTVSLGSELFFRNGDGSLETGTLEAELSTTTRSNWESGLKLTLTSDDLREGFHLSDDVQVLAGKYRFVVGTFSGQTPSGNRLVLEGDVSAGRFYDGNQFVVNLEPNLSITPRIATGGSYQFSRIRFGGRSQEFDSHIVRMRTDLMMNTKLTFSAFLQYVSSGDVIIANARLRYNPRDGNDFYLVWNQGLNTDREDSDPRLPFTTSRALVAKYTYTLLR